MHAGRPFTLESLQVQYSMEQARSDGDTALSSFLSAFKGLNELCDRGSCCKAYGLGLRNTQPGWRPFDLSKDWLHHLVLPDS